LGISFPLYLTWGYSYTVILGVGAITAATIISGTRDINQFHQPVSLFFATNSFLISILIRLFTSTKNQPAKREQTPLAYVFYEVSLSSLQSNSSLKKHSLIKTGLEKTKESSSSSYCQKTSAAALQSVKEQ